MKHLIKPTLMALLLASIVSLAISKTLAQSGNAGYDLSWWSVDGGGTTPGAGGYSLGGTIGQPDVGFWKGNDYTLVGGLWGEVAVEYRVFLPLVLRNR